MGAWRMQSFGLSDSSPLPAVRAGEAPLGFIRHPRAKGPEGRVTNPTSHFQSSDLSFISFAENPTAKPFLARKLLEAAH